MSATKHTAEPWTTSDDGRDCSQVVDVNGRRVAMCIGQSQQNGTNAARIVQCVNTCAKFPDPAAALTDLRQLLGQARGLLAEGDTDRADKMLIVALGVLDGEEG